MFLTQKHSMHCPGKPNHSLTETPAHGLHAKLEAATANPRDTIGLCPALCRAQDATRQRLVTGQQLLPYDAISANFLWVGHQTALSRRCDSFWRCFHDILMPFNFPCWHCKHGSV